MTGLHDTTFLELGIYLIGVALGFGLGWLIRGSKPAKRNAYLEWERRSTQ